MVCRRLTVTLSELRDKWLDVLESADEDDYLTVNLVSEFLEDLDGQAERCALVAGSSSD